MYLCIIYVIGYLEYRHMSYSIRTNQSFLTVCAQLVYRQKKNGDESKKKRAFIFEIFGCSKAILLGSISFDVG